MFEKFGELNSFGEINELAENLFNEGDTESLRAMAKENGIQSDFVDMYLQGEIPALCDQLTAALGGKCQQGFHSKKNTGRHHHTDRRAAKTGRTVQGNERGKPDRD